MALKGGYFGKILRVDLTNRKTWVQEFGEAFALQYVGGRGFGAKMVWDNLSAHPDLDPLGPENMLVVAPGPLTGTYLPASGKNSFISISPATGIYGDSSMGGTFGVEIRQAGYDAIAITGQAEELSYLWVDEDEVRIVRAPELRGKGALEAEGMIKKDVGDVDVKVAVIGPAGENRVAFACVNADWSRNAGRTGIGAIMGAKNLKAVVVRGGKDLPVADVKRMEAIGHRAYATLSAHPFFEFWQQQGLMSVIDYANAAGFIPTRNFKDGWFSAAEQINGYTMEGRYKIGDSACFACPISCGNICLVKEGPYAGTVTEGPEYETAAMFGSNVGIDDFAAVLRGNHVCDDLGVDTISAGNVIGMVIEGYESGLLTLEDLDGTPIRWGDHERILELVEKIARREGIGDVLAGGSKKILETWPQLEPILLQAKGLEQSAYDCRGALSMALAYATSDIGAHHTRAWTIARELEMGQDWSLEEKADLVIFHQTIRPLFDMLGVCRLPWIELGFDEKFYAEQYSAVTGIETTLEELLERARRIYDLTRLINVRLGISRKDDYPPARTFDTPVQNGPLSGKVQSREEYEKILDIYYQKRGWMPEGMPPEGAEARFEGGMV